MLCSAWQFIMAFENAKGLDEKKILPFLFTWPFTIHIKPSEVLGQGFWCLTSSCSGVSGSHLHSCHRGAGPSCDIWEMSARTATPTSVGTESPGLGHSGILRQESRSQREKMERMGRTPVSAPKGRCHKASKLPNLTDSFLIFSFWANIVV